MKKTTYAKPEIQVLILHSACQMLAGSLDGAVKSVSSEDRFTLDNDGLDDNEELR